MDPRQTAVDQGPRSGSVYPLVNFVTYGPDDPPPFFKYILDQANKYIVNQDNKRIVLQTYFATEDPEEIDLIDLSQALVDMRVGYDPEIHSLPLSLTYAANIGTQTGLNTPPNNNVNIRVIDATGTPVLDTTTLNPPQQSAWNDEFVLFNWPDAPRPAFVLLNFAGRNKTLSLINGVPILIDIRACEPTPIGVKKIEVYDATNVKRADIKQGDNVSLKPGYNLNPIINYEPAQDLFGKRNAYLVQLDATPGNGLGVFNNCGDLNDGSVRTVEKVIADQVGNITLNADKCFRIEPVISITNNQATILNGTLQLFDDCLACCDCDDMESVYRAMLRLRRRFEAIGKRIDDLSTKYHAARDKLAASMACDKSSLLRVAAAPVDNCYLSVVAGICNPSDTKIDNVTVKVEVSQVTSGNTGIAVDITSRKAYSWILRNGKPDELGKIAKSGTGYEMDLGCVEGSETKLGALRVYAPVNGKAQVCVTVTQWVAGSLPTPTKTCVIAKAKCE